MKDNQTLIDQLNKATTLGTMPRAVVKRSNNRPPVDYGLASVGPCASATHAMRHADLCVAMPGFNNLAQVASQGKIPGKGLSTDLDECDRHGVGVWTYIQLPGGKKADHIIKAATGIEAQAVRDTLKKMGYAFYKPGLCWRTRCNGTPANGRGGRAVQAYKNALKTDDDNG